MKSIKVSIITCTYNSAATLHFNLESVLRQHYKNIEQIIIDNQSTDDTLKIAGDYSQVKLIVSEPDHGIYDAMNKGIKMATGDIIGILNSDDYLGGPDVIEDIVNTFKETNCDATYGNLIYVKNKHPERIQRVWITGNFKRRQFYYGWMMPHPTLYIKREIYQKYGSFHTGFKLAADYELILRLLMKFQIKAIHIDKVLVYMRAGGAGNKNVKRRLKAHDEDYRAWEVNGLKPKWYTLKMKPIRKIGQFILHYFHVEWLVHIPPSHQNDSFIQDVTNGNGKILYLKTTE